MEAERLRCEQEQIEYRRQRDEAAEESRRQERRQDKKMNQMMQLALQPSWCTIVREVIIIVGSNNFLIVTMTALRNVAVVKLNSVLQALICM